MAGSCPYFEAMFTSEMSESRMTEIDIHEITPEAMELLINFCYSAQIKIEESNVQQLLPAACLLQITEIQQYCCEFLSKQLHPTNCLGRNIRKNCRITRFFNSRKNYYHEDT